MHSVLPKSCQRPMICQSTDAAATVSRLAVDLADTEQLVVASSGTPVATICSSP